MQGPTNIISVVDVEVEEERDRKLAQIEGGASGKRCQPPMVDRLRATVIQVEHLEAQGVPFGTARNSRMNKEVRKRLNDRMRYSSDPRKSRQKILGSDAVRDILREVEKIRS
jgi:hypothetical protein